MTDSPLPTQLTCAHVEPIVFTEKEVCALLRLPRDQVRLARVNGQLPYRQLGPSSQSIRYTREDIDSFLANQSRVGVNRLPPGPDGQQPRVLSAPRIRGQVA